MKRSTLLFLGVFFCVITMAQTQQGINHQAVIRDADGKLVTNKTIGIQVSILQGEIEGTAVYAETHAPQSNAHGLITYIIGHGTIVNGIFEEIDWSQGSYFLKTEVDPMGGTNYSIVGTTQFFSVPFAYVSQNLPYIDPRGSKQGDFLIFNSNTGRFEPGSWQSVISPNPLSIKPMTGLRGQYISVTFSGGDVLQFSQASSSCPEVYADVVLRFTQGTTTTNIYPAGKHFISSGRFDAVFDIPHYIPSGLYNIILGPSTPCEHATDQQFRIF